MMKKLLVCFLAAVMALSSLTVLPIAAAPIGYQQLGYLVFLPCGFLTPFNSCLRVLRYAIAVYVHQSKIEQGISIPLFCCLVIPSKCFLIVLWNTPSVFIHTSKAVLGKRESLFCCLGIPFKCLFVVLFYTLTFFKHDGLYLVSWTLR